MRMEKMPRLMEVLYGERDPDRSGSSGRKREDERSAGADEQRKAAEAPGGPGPDEPG